MKIELKNIQVNKRLSEETTCYSATLYVDGVRVAEVGNHGQGGPDEFRLLSNRGNDNVYQEIQRYLATLPPLASDYEGMPPLPMDLELYCGELLTQWEDAKLLKKKTYVRLKGEKYRKGEWIEFNRPFDAGMKAALVKKYGDKIDVIANETGRLA